MPNRHVEMGTLDAFATIQTMVSVKEATEKALVFATDLLGSERVTSARLEEVESANYGSEDVWPITLSLPGSDIPFTLFRRDYNTFTVRKSDGEVLSMKIRHLAAA